MRRLLLLSSSNVHGCGFLQYAAADVQRFLAADGVTRVLLVPYAQLDHEAHFAVVSGTLRRLGFHCDSLHRAGGSAAQRRAIQQAEALFVAGGNTFLLLRALYDHGLLEPIRKSLNLAYVGCSAGTNVATVNIATTNDMPIVHPPSYAALGLVPFNINPHYCSETRGDSETRDERILQYLRLPHAHPVLAMREGCILHVDGKIATLQGLSNAVLFEPRTKPRELAIGTDVSALFKPSAKEESVA